MCINFELSTGENVHENEENIIAKNKKCGPYQDRTGDLFCVREA